MKKLPLIITLSFLAPFAHADRVLGLYAGAGSWLSDYDGKAGNPSVTLNDLGVKEDYNNYFYVAIEHPIPFIPNIRLTQTNLKSSQTGTVTQSFTIGDTTYAANESVKSSFDLSHRDATLYYQLLDNWINLDLGVTARQFDGYVRTESASSNENLKIDLTAPLLYAKAQFDLPFTGLSAGVEGNYTSYQDNSLSDYSAKLTYLFDTVVDVGVEVGYRKMSIKISDNDLEADMTLKGPYAALIAHF
ncbi:membrane protein [Cellvibrio zantedeschiae]|uniref:Membrane protein n=1 Tax=Cellvibrio zantedeschiae TaxID=1237077 RepID=A0ABQ3B3K7_9GAMM|nr:TIGR04219 family outer membrane beta-barrel protein [Cellvibrio zantedeschiae]GGY73107.1 membrane protein [Cellvibrio zantedeschiae]